ncbi:TetR/AcrR family transcriptional regulator [Microlunatus sp. GCM10028923]|uniref:TetR/AcrR family transcriptional regulator n=1 Tax=Microlunatus sp. GCM10028923 TaxID=3273400 RepID=UPI00361FC3B8
MARATPMSAEDRRAMIIAATEPLLREHGRTVSTKQIAEAAGVAEGTIFRVFDSKQALIDAVLERAFSSEVTLQQLLQIPTDASLRDRLVEMARVMQQRMIESFTLIHAIGPPAEPQEDDRRKLRDRMIADAELLTDAITKLIGDDAHQLRVDGTAAAFLLRSTVFALSHPMVAWVHGWHLEATDPEAIVDLLLYGLDDTGRPAQRVDLAAAFAQVSQPGTHNCARPSAT